MCRFALGLFLVVVASLSAQDISLKVGETKPISLRISGDEYNFGVSGGVSWKQDKSDATHLKLQLTGVTPGSAMISIAIYKNGKITDVAFISISIAGQVVPAPPTPPVPPIPPGPEPPPVPPPGPKAASVWTIIIEESSERTAPIAKVMNDLAYWQSLKAKGHFWRFYDKDSPEAKAKGYADKAAAVGLPAVLILDAKTGGILKAFKLPATTAEIDVAIKEVTK